MRRATYCKLVRKDRKSSLFYTLYDTHYTHKPVNIPFHYIVLFVYILPSMTLLKPLSKKALSTTADPKMNSFAEN